MRYDSTDKNSILKHARLLLGKSLHDLYENIEVISDYAKGRLGQAVEKYHFEYEPNNNAEPDFPDAEVELKCTPLKVTHDNSLVAKERLVLNIIDYISEADKTFETSSFWHKNQCLLLMFYLHNVSNNEQSSFIDFVFKIIRYWEFSDVDLKIIKDDWDKIHNKILLNKADEISEGDTLYLSACVKGSKGGANKRHQKNPSAPLADQRAYSLKQGYVNRIILDSIIKQIGCSDNLFISDYTKKRWIAKYKRENEKFGSIIESLALLNSSETLEDYILRQFETFYGKTSKEIEQQLNVKIGGGKAYAYNLCRAILHVKSNKIDEFEKAEILLKTIRLEETGFLRESMSFANINYNEIINEDYWEDSFWYKTLTRRFIFVIFEKSNVKNSLILKRILFWNMPPSDLQQAKIFWTDTKNKISNGDYSHFIKSTENPICHVRPKAKNSHDLTITPQGTREKKMCYWLNRRYIMNIIGQ